MRWRKAFSDLNFRSIKSKGHITDNEYCRLRLVELQLKLVEQHGK